MVVDSSRICLWSTHACDPSSARYRPPSVGATDAHRRPATQSRVSCPVASRRRGPVLPSIPRCCDMCARPMPWRRAAIGDPGAHLPLVRLWRVRPLPVELAGTGRPGPGECGPSQAAYHSRAPGRRCRASGVTLAAPPAAIAATVASIDSSRVGQAGQDRRHQHAHREAGVGEAAHRVQAPARARRAGLDRAPQSPRRRSRREADADPGDLGRLPEQVEVAQDQRALGQDRERVGEVAQRAAGSRASAGIGPRRAGNSPRWCPSRCGRPSTSVRPARGAAARGVDLHHHLGVEVVARVQVEVGVGVAGEAVVADHAVGDEVAGAGGDVEQRQVEPERRRSIRRRAVASGLMADARDRRACGVSAGSTVWKKRSRSASPPVARSPPLALAACGGSQQRIGSPRSASAAEPDAEDSRV